MSNHGILGDDLTATYSVIPLSNLPNQSLTATISINGQNITLNLKFSYNQQAQYWVMTILDQHNNMILDSIPLLCSQPPAQDLLGQYQYLGIGSCFIMNVGNSTLDSPNDQVGVLGQEFVLIWGDSLA